MCTNSCNVFNLCIIIEKISVLIKCYILHKCDICLKFACDVTYICVNKTVGPVTKCYIPNCGTDDAEYFNNQSGIGIILAIMKTICLLAVIVATIVLINEVNAEESPAGSPGGKPVDNSTPKATEAKVTTKPDGSAAKNDTAKNPKPNSSYTNQFCIEVLSMTVLLPYLIKIVMN